MKKSLEYLEGENSRLRKIGIILLTVVFLILLFTTLIASWAGVSLVGFQPYFMSFAGIYGTTIIGFLGTKPSPTSKPSKTSSPRPSVSKECE